MTMKSRVKLGTKLWGLTCLLLMAVLIVAGNSMWTIRGILSTNNQFSEAADANVFMIAKEVDHLTWMGRVQALFVNNDETLDVQLDHTRCGLGAFIYGKRGKALADRDPELATLLNGIKAPHQQLHDSAKSIEAVWRQRHDGLTDMLKDRLDDHRRWAATVARIVIERDPEIQVQLDHNLCAFGKFLSGETYAGYSRGFPALQEAMEAAKIPHGQLHASAKEIRASVQSGDLEKAAVVYNTVTMAKLQEIQDHFKAAISAEAHLEKAQAEAMHLFNTATAPAVAATQAKIKALSERLQSIQQASKAEMVSTGSRSQWSSAVVTAGIFILGGLLSFILVRSIVGPIRLIIGGLNQSADQVTAASGQVSTASNQLAEGSSEQAASIEETSSSLEEMSSMTKQNADHSSQANHLMGEANQVMDEAGSSMNDLNGSMNEIAKASQETSKIIKTIDEIAFQTNLLALNAAVEAARAGEAGAGFAVVADEVRNLAMRAAEAAKSTAELIESTVKRVDGGTGLVGQTSTAFARVTESVSRVGELVAEIAAASGEQAEGIEQINKAVSEMDKVVQQNAANAEENAGASEEMNAQAAQLREFVNEMVLLVGRNDNGRKSGSKPSIGHGSETKIRKISAIPTINPGKAETVKRAEKEIHPNQVIPLDDTDFREF